MVHDDDQRNLVAFGQRLDARRAELERLIADGRCEEAPVSPDSAIGRLTRQDAMQQQQMSAALVRRYEQELVPVEKALRAIEEGTYGRCQRCDEPIAIARLQAMPHATICIGCAERQAGSGR